MSISNSVILLLGPRVILPANTRLRNKNSKPTLRTSPGYNDDKCARDPDSACPGRSARMMEISATDGTYVRGRTKCALIRHVLILSPNDSYSMAAH